MTKRGTGVGFLIFLGIVILAYLTPLRIPVLKHAGRDYAAYQLQLRERQQAFEALRARDASSGTLERARNEIADAQASLRTWHRLSARISPFGLLAWFSNLWPWLLGLGIALPLLGGLIGRQIRTAEPAPHRKFHPSETPEAPEPTEAAEDREGGEAEVRTDPATPTESPAEDAGPAPQEPQAPPAPEHPPVTSAPDRRDDSGPASWNWSARPVSRPPSARPKPPSVRSPHGDKSEE